MPSPTSDVMRRSERANAFCESIRALDATGLLFFRTGNLFFSFPFCTTDSHQLPGYSSLVQDHMLMPCH